MDVDGDAAESIHDISTSQPLKTIENLQKELDELVPVKLEALSVEQRLQHELSTWSSVSYHLRRNRGALPQELAQRIAYLSWTLFDPYSNTTLLHRQRAVVEALSRDPCGARHLLHLASQAPLTQTRTLRFLNVILPRITSSTVLDVMPDIIPNCLAAFNIRDDSTCSLAARLLLALIPNLPTSTAYDDKSFADNIAEMLIDPNLRERLSNQLLKPLLQARSSLAGLLLKASQDKTASNPYSADAYSAGLVVINALPHAFQGRIERSTLVTALESSSLELRCSAILCLSSSRSAESVHDRIPLFLNFLHNNIGDHSPLMRNTLVTCLWPMFRQICSNNRSTQSALDTFFSPLIEVISKSLSPHRPYRFRINSIKILEALMDFLHKTSNSDLSPILDLLRTRNNLSVLLLMALLDSYDDIQRTSSTLLSRYNNVFVIKSSHRQWLVSLSVSLIQAQKEKDSDAGTLVLDLIRNIWIIQHDEKIDLSLPYSNTELSNTSSSQLYLFSQLVAFAEHLSALTESDLAKAATETPIHGTLQSLAKIIEKLDLKKDTQYEEYGKLFRRCLSVVDRVFNASSRVLCNEAPEGAETSTTDHEESRAMLLTNDDSNTQVSLEAGVSDDDAKHKVILSACWRSVTSAGDLLEKIFSTPARAGFDILKQIWSYDEIDLFGKTYASWLLNIRHRGAFSSIYPAYYKLCASVSSLKGSWDDVSVLPEKWLNAHMDHMLTNTLSTTRRSAGLPFCVLAVLFGTIDKFKHLSPEIGTRLLEAAERTEQSDDKSAEISRIHIMNTLKTLFSDAKVGNALESCVEATFSLAIRNYQSPNWGVRNASTMLFAMLVQRTVTHHRSTTSSTRSIPAVNFFKRFPSLYNTLYDELLNAIKEDEEDHSKYKTMEFYNRLYSILLLLSFLRSIESVTAEEHERIKVFIAPIEKCVSNRVWKIREVVAKAYTSFTLPRDVLDSCSNQLSSLGQCCERGDYNEVHGRLLIILNLLRREKLISTDVWSFAKELEKGASWFLDLRNPPTIRSTFIDIFMEVVGSCGNEARLQAFKKEFVQIQDCISKQLALMNLSNQRVTGDSINYLFTCARFFLSLDSGKHLNYFLSIPQKDLTLLIVRHISTKSQLVLSKDALQTLARLANDVNSGELLQESILTYAASNLELANELASMTSFADIESRYRCAVTVPLREALLIPLAVSPSNEKEMFIALEILDSASCTESAENSRTAACKALLLLVENLKGHKLASSRTLKNVFKQCQLLSIRLLQDDDEDIRAIAETVANALSGLSDGSKAHHICENGTDNVLSEPSLTKQNALALESIWPSLLDSYEIDEIVLHFILKPAGQSVETLQLNETKLFPMERANLYEDDEGNLNIIQSYIQRRTDVHTIRETHHTLLPSDQWPASYPMLTSICERLDSLDMKMAIRTRLGTLLWAASCVISVYNLMFPSLSEDENGRNGSPNVGRLEMTVRHLQQITQWSNEHL